MKQSKMWLAASLLLVVVMVLSSCAAPTPQVVEKVVTQVVKEAGQIQTQVEKTGRRKSDPGRREGQRSRSR